jgi:class 3 adenylate cyclase
LPDAAAEEIRNVGTVIPRRYDDVAVLFCDVVNFTSYCDKHEPEEVVSRLDALFVAFERVAATYGLEKIKTIGDAFMAAAGLLRKADAPLESAVLCGLQMAATSLSPMPQRRRNQRENASKLGTGNNWRGVPPSLLRAGAQGDGRGRRAHPSSSFRRSMSSSR